MSKLELVQLFHGRQQFWKPESRTFCTVQLSEKLHGDTLRCITVAAPPLVSRDAATHCSGYVTGVVCQDDLVPRASLANFEDLRKEIIACNWSEKLKSEVRAGTSLEYLTPPICESR